MPTNLWTSAQEFRHHDRLQAIALAERNSQSQNPRKSITVQHFSDNGTPDSPAELVVCQAGHSPIAMKSINGGYYVATENDPDAVVRTERQNREREYQNQ
jgi:hypothetical protein